MSLQWSFLLFCEFHQNILALFSISDTGSLNLFPFAVNMLLREMWAEKHKHSISLISTWKNIQVDIFGAIHAIMEMINGVESSSETGSIVFWETLYCWSSCMFSSFLKCFPELITENIHPWTPFAELFLTFKHRLT